MESNKTTPEKAWDTTIISHLLRRNFCAGGLGKNTLIALPLAKHSRSVHLIDLSLTLSSLCFAGIESTPTVFQLTRGEIGAKEEAALIKKEKISSYNEIHKGSGAKLYNIHV